MCYIMDVCCRMNENKMISGVIQSDALVFVIVFLCYSVCYSAAYPPIPTQQRLSSEKRNPCSFDVE